MSTPNPNIDRATLKTCKDAGIEVKVDPAKASDKDVRSEVVRIHKQATQGGQR